MAVRLRHRLFIVGSHLVLAEAGQCAAGGQAVIFNDKVVVLNRILLQLVSIGMGDGLAVDLGELSGDLRGHSSDFVDDGE